MFYIFVIVFLLIFGVILKIYIKFTTGWCRSKTCLVGKTAIITGANTGIGFETALDFAKRGARVILACRDEKRAEDARYKVIEETGNKNVVVKLINMSSFNSVREFAKEINETEDRLDILVNNAGAGGIGDKKSKDGHVLLMQINYFSSFLLTHLLIGLLKKTKGSRVINVSSMVAKYAKNFDVSNVDKYPGIVTVYYYSKLCNILFTKELARRLEGTEVTTYSLHPGAVKTELYRHAKNGYKLLFQFLTNIFFKTSEEGAQTTIYCSVTKRIEKYSGEHFEDCQKVASYKTVADPDLPKKLWEFTQDIVQLKPDEILT
ncbi:retinol dehydrogenase 11-like [Tribolium castaneum]